MPSANAFSRFASLAAAVLVAASLAACSGTGTGLAPGLSAPMDQPGATLDRRTALALINDYRRSRGAAPLTADPALDSVAQGLASEYAASDTRPASPQGIDALRVSAGYSTFAETFSGWRNSPEDSNYLTASGVSRAGLAAVYSPDSAYGVYWVLVLAG